MDIREIFSRQYGWPLERITINSDTARGDVSVPCFEMAKQQRVNPKALAESLANEINNNKPAFIAKAEAVNGFLNLFVTRSYFADSVIRELTTQDVERVGTGKTVAIDYCSANLAKHFHIGHFSTTMIGECLARLNEALGYKVVRINYLGDYGTPFGKMVVATQLWSSKEEIIAGGVDKIQDLYVRFAQNETEELLDKARNASKLIEEKAGEEYELYRVIIEIAYKETKAFLKIFDIEFDDDKGESAYSDDVQPKVDEILQLGVAKRSGDAVIVDLEECGLGISVLRRSDGGSMYITRDLCAVEDRYNKYKFDSMLYVVAVQQKLHFAQLFEICKRLNAPYAGNLQHVSYGMFSTPEGKIASRNGKQALVKDILQMAENKAAEVIKGREFKIEKREDVIKKIARSSLALSILKVERNKDKIFDIDKAISFEGETAPYLMYTYARMCSIFRKAADIPIENNVNAQVLNPTLDGIFNEYFDMFMALNDFRKNLLRAQRECEPAFIARNLFDLAQAFNRFYNNVKIINKDDIATTQYLLNVISAIKATFATGLRVLAVDTLEEM